jgi:chromosome partitioning protein
MLIVAVAHQKGGAGKTTIAVNLAAAAHLEGLRTLVVDMDKQASAFEWSAARREGSRLDGITVVRADRALPLARFNEITRGYDAVFLDGPPRLGEITQSAAVAADLALIPVAGALDLWTVRDTCETLSRADEIREQLGRPPVRRALVANRITAGTRMAELVAAALADTPEAGPVIGTIRHRVSFQMSALEGESVLTFPAPIEARAEITQLWRAAKGFTDDRKHPKTKQPRRKQARAQSR